MKQKWKFNNSPVVSTAYEWNVAYTVEADGTKCFGLKIADSSILYRKWDTYADNYKITAYTSSAWDIKYQTIILNQEASGTLLTYLQANATLVESYKDVQLKDNSGNILHPEITINDIKGSYIDIDNLNALKNVSSNIQDQLNAIAQYTVVS